MKYIDIHTHHGINLPEVLSVKNLLNPDQLESGLKNPGYYSIGIHPWHIHPDHWQEDVELVEQFIHHERVLAIGEAGLDRLTDLPLDLQNAVFRSMVMLSEMSQKPLIIHAVRTHAEILLLHQQLLPSQPWIIHGFNLRTSIAQAFIDKGFYLSFGQAILNHHAAACKSLEITPIHQLFLETDDQQADIKEVYQRAAELKGITIEELSGTIEKEFKTIIRYAGS